MNRHNNSHRIQIVDENEFLLINYFELNFFNKNKYKWKNRDILDVYPNK